MTDHETSVGVPPGCERCGSMHAADNLTACLAALDIRVRRAETMRDEERLTVEGIERAAARAGMPDTEGLLIADWLVFVGDALRAAHVVRC